MRILICGINFAPELTGIGKYTGEMAEWVASHGHEVRVVTAPPYYPMWQILPDYHRWRYSQENLNGVKVYRCPLWVPSSPSGLTRVLHHISFAVSSFLIMVWQGIWWRPNIVWVVEPPFLMAPGALISGWAARCRTWLHVQDFEIDTAFELEILNFRSIRRFVNGIELWVMKLFNRVSTISEAMFERLITKGLDQRKCVYFPNWVDTNLIFPLQGPSPMRRELGIPDGDTVALYSGNMGEKQGLEIVIDAARHLQDKKTHRFIFCGDGVTRTKIQRLASGLPNVQFLPLQAPERLNQLLNLADVHLLPHGRKAADLALPSKLLGMLASGRPVVAVTSHDTQVARIVKDCGIVVPPNDSSGLANSIKFLIENAQPRVDFGQAGRAYALQHWEKEKVLKRFQADLCQNS